MQKLANQIVEVNYCWSECDAVIGQGLGGELGGMAVAQITILKSLRNAINSLDDFLVSATILASEEEQQKPGAVGDTGVRA